VQTIHFDDCSGQLAIHDYYELADNDFLKFHNIQIDDYNGFITHINTRIGPLRNQLVRQQKIMMSYILGGLLFVSIMATVLGIFVNYWISFGMIGVYCLGLLVVIRTTNKIGKNLEKSVHINLSMVLLNYSRDCLRPIH